MSNDRETLLHHWFEEVWNKGQPEAIDQLMAPDAIAHGITDAQGNDVRGPDAFKGFFHTFREAFPDIRVTVMDSVAAGDKVAARCHVEGTHQGGSLGIAGTGKRVTFGGICLARVENGQIVEAWNHFDFLAMYQQIGLQIAPA